MYLRGSQSSDLTLALCNSFSSAVSRLFELGVPTQQFVSPEQWDMPTVDEQKDAAEAAKSS